ncbi:hypothetical protein LX15_002232 [Streptoalloteichus tenebrarius]|uniref:Uncharacterized protein n=1 Tax=Streptoalloteichus tenebrarius (strain ATCC 17920 / DSM 40477 / JCM 4838 / CBS 697.72 / NBRC 16177 / NCIMB 11028 / NRRL B-12390 / A12253. 1 / ISP 5477) TaxID=1933 RepID=A0ABT1HSN6_STRSD|nr:hypothetical protein [Streptoalloteichus tenebrarius]
MVNEHTVVLFGHCPVEAAQTGFEVHEGCAGGVGGQCTSERRGGVSLNQYGVRFVQSEDLVKCGHQNTELVTSANVVVMVEFKGEVRPDMPGLKCCPVFTINASGPRRPVTGASFDGFRTGEHDNSDPHGQVRNSHQKTCVRSPAQKRRAATNNLR